MSPTFPDPARRALLAGGLLLPFLAVPAWAASRTLSFAAFRNGSKVGEHHLVLDGDGAAMTATAEVAMSVRLGPVPVFRYRHRAVERWSGGRFRDLESTTTANGKVQRVLAERTAAGVRIEGGAGARTASATAAPLTHWNPAIFAGPLFNPQDGKALKVRAIRVEPGHWSLRGEIEIDDYYDEAGAWRALSGRLEDGSRMEYRRL
ncbi:MAG: DUF6134 family protein [Phenylobacterium sp.]